MRGRDLSPSELIRVYGGKARKRFGQNFLVDRNALERIADLADLREGLPVIEIGPGPGALTSTLLRRDVKLTAIELDWDLAAHLRETFGDDENFTLVEGDAQKVPLDDLLVDRETRVAANLPYNVATPILLRLVDHPQSPKRLVLMFQKEVADRICAPIGSRDSGWLTLALTARYSAKIGLRLPPGAFNPAPKIDSAVVVLERRETPLCSVEDEQSLRKLAEYAFRGRRKTIRNTLKPFIEEETFLAANVDSTLRCDVLDFPAWMRLLHALPDEARARLDQGLCAPSKDKLPD